MKRNVIYFVDEDPPARRANVAALKALLGTSEINVEGLEPLKSFAHYDPFIASPTTAAFILDQRMKQAGIVDYDGTDLAEYFRGIDSKMPIYILTGYAGSTDDFRGSEFRVEEIIPKDQIDDPASEKAKIIKARLLRRLDVFNDVRGAQEQRFHDLLVKSLRKPLTSEEQREMDQIEGESTAPIVAAERNKERELGEQIDKLRKLIDGGDRPL